MMSIGEFAASVGASVRTVTRYVNEGKLTPTARTAGGHMRFAPAKRKEFQNIWRDPRGRPRGSSAAITEPFTRTGTTTPRVASTASAFVRRTLKKRRIASPSSC